MALCFSLRPSFFFIFCILWLLFQKKLVSISENQNIQGPKLKKKKFTWCKINLKSENQPNLKNKNPAWKTKEGKNTFEERLFSLSLSLSLSGLSFYCALFAINSVFHHLVLKNRHSFAERTMREREKEKAFVFNGLWRGYFCI